MASFLMFSEESFIRNSVELSGHTTNWYGAHFYSQRICRQYEIFFNFSNEKMIEKYFSMIYNKSWRNLKPSLRSISCNILNLRNLQIDIASAGRLLKIAAKPLRISEFKNFRGGFIATFGRKMSSNNFQNTPFILYV